MSGSLHAPDAPIPHCDGKGSRYYGSTAAWRCGMGEAAITRDLCDQCWGSGDARLTWTSALAKVLREMSDGEAADG